MPSESRDATAMRTSSEAVKRRRLHDEPFIQIISAGCVEILCSKFDIPCG
jgi:hypothetical protein